MFGRKKNKQIEELLWEPVIDGFKMFLDVL